MTITLDADLEMALNEAARKQATAPEALALEVLRAKFLADRELQPRDEWERELLAIGHDCGVSLSNEALGREVLYD
jgi:hypothetical protein